MKRDTPSRIDLDENIVSVRDSQSDIEMVSVHEQDQQTEDSSPDSNTENSNHTSDESDQDWASDHHSDSGSDPGSNPSLDLGSNAGSGCDYGGDPKFSDEDGGDFTDLFMPKKECPGSSKRPQS